MTPEETRHAFSAGLSQDFGESLKFDLRGLYSKRENIGNAGPIRTSAATTSATPTYVNLPSPDTNRPQNVLFTYGPVLGSETREETTILESWQVTPKLSWDIGAGWQLRGLASYGETPQVRQRSGEYRVGKNADQQRRYQSVQRGVSNRAAVDSIVAHNKGDSAATSENIRAIADGPIFSLPGGEVRVAVAPNTCRPISNAASRTLQPSRLIRTKSTSKTSYQHLEKRRCRSSAGTSPFPACTRSRSLLRGAMTSTTLRFDLQSEVRAHLPTRRVDFGTTWESLSPRPSVGSVGSRAVRCWHCQWRNRTTDARRPTAASVLDNFDPLAWICPRPGGAEIKELVGKPGSESTHRTWIDVERDLLRYRSRWSHRTTDRGGGPFAVLLAVPDLWTAFPTQAQIVAQCSQVPSGLEQCARYIGPNALPTALSTTFA